jgi:diadenosine tetraphosphate (Ap4A) HIT family hydrolase
MSFLLSSGSGLSGARYTCGRGPSVYFSAVTPLELLWNGWRSTYVRTVDPNVSGVESNGSVFRRILDSGLPDVDTHIVFRGEQVFSILNAFPYAVGHVLVLPYREVAELEELTASEHVELWATVTDAVRAVRSAMSPGGVNVGLNLGRPAGGSVSSHLHVHVVPRWIGDANFMTTTANTRTLPESLGDTAARLRAAWP